MTSLTQVNFLRAADVEPIPDIVVTVTRRGGLKVDASGYRVRRLGRCGLRVTYAVGTKWILKVDVPRMFMGSWFFCGPRFWHFHQSWKELVLEDSIEPSDRKHFPRIVASGVYFHGFGCDWHWILETRFEVKRRGKLTWQTLETVTNLAIRYDIHDLDLEELNVGVPLSSIRNFGVSTDGTPVIWDYASCQVDDNDGAFIPVAA